MNKKEVLIKEIEDLPEGKLAEVLDFVRELKFRRREGELDISLVSEPSLAKDWLKPEEDKAWDDL